MNKINDIARWLSDSLRYLLSGGVAVVTLALIHQRRFHFLDSLSYQTQSSGIALVAIVSIIGFTTYSIHRALLFPLCHLMVLHYVKRSTFLWYYRTFRPDRDVHISYAEIDKDSLGGNIISSLRITDIMTDIRLQRLTHENEKTLDGAIARHLERWASSVHGLYCCCWACCAIIVMALFNAFDRNTSGITVACFIAGFLFISSVIHHVRFLKEELRIGAEAIANSMKQKLEPKPIWLAEQWSTLHSK